MREDTIFEDDNTPNAQRLRVDDAINAINGLNELSRVIHKNNHFWWHSIHTGERIDRNRGELLALVHSEISEALEGERKGKMDDHLPHRKSAEVELADALIRIFDYAGAFGYDLAGALRDKLLYNISRADHTHAARLADGGKKF